MQLNVGGREVSRDGRQKEGGERGSAVSSPWGRGRAGGVIGSRAWTTGWGCLRGREDLFLLDLTICLATSTHDVSHELLTFLDTSSMHFYTSPTISCTNVRMKCFSAMRWGARH